jgi:hypothetical protein
MFEKGNSYAHNGKGGRPLGVRNKLSRIFLEELVKDFEENGAAAIRLCRIETPTKYVQIVASILPKELLVESSVTDLADEELDRIVAALRERVLTERQEQALNLTAEPVKVIANGNAR